MNSKMVIAASFIVVLFVLWLVGPCAARLNKENGIVILPGYEHAVGMCGTPSLTEEAIVIGNEGVILNEKTFYLIVNEGHTADKELINLKALTLVECN